jgi:hypothetical protein
MYVFNEQAFELKLDEMVLQGQDALVIKTGPKLTDEVITKIQELTRKRGYNIFYYNNEYLLIYYSTRRYYWDVFTRLMDTNDKMLINFVVAKINGYSNNIIHAFMKETSESEKKD